MFERGKELERGRSPLSSKLPSPAINACIFLSAILAGEGTGVRRQLPTEGSQNHKKANRRILMKFQHHFNDNLT
jgi:hypothetical protein